MFEISKNSFNQSFTFEEYGINLKMKENKIFINVIIPIGEGCHSSMHFKNNNLRLFNE